jgi:hypothetical protein
VAEDKLAAKPKKIQVVDAMQADHDVGWPPPASSSGALRINQNATPAGWLLPVRLASGSGS